MGFGFNLFMVFLVFPGSIVLFIFWLVTEKKIFGFILAAVWLAILGLILLSFIVSPFVTNKVLSKSDYYGDYVIDRSSYPGKDADWQYNHFRFTITESDSIHFHITDGDEIIKTVNGSITTNTDYASDRLIINVGDQLFHVLAENPTTYREIWNFYLVFNSSEYNNMFFRKGKWEPIDD